MYRELGLDSLRWLNRNYYIAGQVCYSRNCKFVVSKQAQKPSFRRGQSEGYYSIRDIPASSGAPIFNVETAAAILLLWCALIRSE
jgi:hypothetical protein